MADVINIVLVYCEGQEMHCYNRRQSMYDGTPENGACATLTVVKDLAAHPVQFQLIFYIKYMYIPLLQELAFGTINFQSPWSYCGRSR